jgi:polyhydroxybutyrate depolymerase
MTQTTRIAKATGKAITTTILVILGLLMLGAVIIAVLFSWLDETNGKIVSSGQDRTYLLFVPTTYDPATPTPLVICIHGFAEWPAHQMQISGWNDLAEEYGFIVVYPSGTGFPRRWHASGQAGDSGDPMTDVLFISDLIDELGRQYNIDPARVYANGLSNGGGFSYMLGCTLSDRIAAVGSVSGAYVFPLDECNPSRPVPMIAFHGTGDPIVPYQGGPSRDSGVSFPVIPDWMAARAELNGCDGSPAELPVSGEVSGIRYSGCAQGADLVFYTIHGGGHAWPGGEPMPAWIVGYTTQDINATPVMWEFFSRFSIGD